MTVSHGTHRTQDLIPLFMDELRGRDPAAYDEMVFGPFGAVPAHAAEDDEADWWQSEDATYLLVDIMDALNLCAPEGTYFGAHPGDGSDFGYWPEETLAAE